MMEFPCIFVKNEPLWGLFFHFTTVFTGTLETKWVPFNKDMNCPNNLEIYMKAILQNKMTHYMAWPII